MKNNIVPWILLLLTFPLFGLAQNNFIDERQYEVNVNHPPLSMSKEKLKKADSLVHLHRRYPSSWIKEYISVEVLTSFKGKIRKAVNKNEVLSEEQKDHMNTADADTDISIVVHYIPENNLKENPPRVFDFKFAIQPEMKAEFPGGEQHLKQYLKNNLYGKIADSVLTQYQLAVVTFTVDEEGIVTDPHLFWSSEDEKTDQLMIETICNMPKWKPAEYSRGVKVKQEFALTVGDMKSCVVNMLNIPNYGIANNN